MIKTAKRERLKETRLNAKDNLDKLGKIEIIHVLNYKDANYRYWKEVISIMDWEFRTSS